LSSKCRRVSSTVLNDATSKFGSGFIKGGEGF